MTAHSVLLLICALAGGGIVGFALGIDYGARRILRDWNRAMKAEPTAKREGELR